MRNLKRTLSLVLAAVMLVGMMVVGAPAASSDFVDGNEITYAEAAEVMTALGVFEGTDKGAFDPTGILTREQAAAIICRMLLGDDAENLTTNSTVFSDVAADRWSAGYIGYCAQQNILAGTGNGTFNPEGELTGLAFAKMLLVALGYDPAIEQYVGNDWAVNVAADAVDAGIAVSGVIMADAMTREQAAQMAYQTLEADMVRYASRGTTIQQPDGSTIIVGNTAAEPVSKTDSDYAGDSNDDTQQFCERYFADLKKVNGEDDFARPASQYVGNDWAVNVAADAVDAGIAVSGVIMADAMTREQAAQMAYQTLEADMVRYASRGTTIQQPDGSTIIVGNTAAEPVSKTDSDYAGDSNDDTQQFCERYFADLKKVNGEDDFARPASQWKLKNDIIGTYPAEADGTFTTAVDKGDLYDVIGRTVYNDITASKPTDFSVYVDGDPVSSPDVADYFVNNETDDAKGTAKGVLTQVFVDDDNNVILSQIHTYVAQVDGGYDEENEELELDDLGLDTFPAVNTTLSADDFENLSAFEDGDYVLITAVGDEVKTIQAAEVVSGTVTSYTSNKNVTLDGTKYEYSQGYSSTYNLKDDYDLVLDTYGYVIYADGVEASNDYVFITNVAQIGGVNKSFEAKAYFVDGTTAVIEVSNADDLEWESSDKTKNTWFSYDEKNDGTYELGKLNSNDSASKDFNTTGKIIETGDARISLDKSVRLNNDTVFVIRRGDNVNVYTGIRNVPDVNITHLESDAEVEVVAILDDNGYADYLFINGETGELGVSGSVAGDRIYILDTDYESSQDADDNKYYVFDAIVNGEIGTVNLNSTSDVEVGLYGNVTYDADGYVNTSDLNRINNAVSGNDLRVWNVDSTIAYSSGVLSFDGVDLVLADEYTIFLNDGGTGKTTTPSRLARDYEDDNFKGVISAVYDGDAVIEVYVDEDNSVITDETVAEVEEAVSDAVVNADGAWGQNGDLGNYVAHGTWNSDGTKVTASFEQSAISTESNAITWDTARFLGSLHKNGATTIVYDGVTYVWDKDGGLQGSNWYDSSDKGLTTGDNANTLVKALADAGVFDGDETATATLTVDGVDITITFSVSE